MADAFGLGLHRSPQHIGMNAFGKDHTLRITARGITQLARHLRLVSHQFAQVQGVCVPVLDGLARHTALHRSPCHSHGNFGNQTRIHGLRDEIGRAEREVVHVVSRIHHVGHRLLGDSGNGAHGGQFHLLVDGLGTRVQRATENVRETYDVVDLVGIVGTAGGHQHVGARSHGILVGNLRHGIGQREYDGRRSHATHHVLREHVAARKAEEHVRTLDGFRQRVHVGTAGGEETLLFIQVRALLGDDPLAVQHQDVFETCAQGNIQLGARNSRSPRTVHHNLHVLNLLPCHFQSVQQPGTRNDGRAVLVVVHDGNVKLFLQPTFDFETLRSLDVFQVNATERRRNGFHRFDKLLRVFLVNLNVEHVNAGIYLEQQALAFHHRLAGQRADVAQPQHSRAVGNHSHQVAFCRITVSIVRVLLYFKARFRHARGISQRQVCLRTVGLGRHHLNFSRLALLVVAQSHLFGDFCHVIMYF